MAVGWGEVGWEKGCVGGRGEVETGRNEGRRAGGGKGREGKGYGVEGKEEGYVSNQ